jgi:hypothetical protein
MGLQIDYIVSAKNVSNSNSDITKRKIMHSKILKYISTGDTYRTITCGVQR